MLPQIVGPGTFASSPLAPSVAERTMQGAEPGLGETAAAATRPEVANRVDPPKVIPAPLPLPPERKRAEPLVPPDPEAPAGPPPAFEATPLERERERALAPADLIARPAPAATRDAEASVARVPDAAETPEARAEALRERLETDVAEVRRMAEPEPERAVNVTL